MCTYAVARPREKVASFVVAFAHLCTLLFSLLILSCLSQPLDGSYKRKDRPLERAGLHVLRCEGSLGEGIGRRAPKVEHPSYVSHARCCLFALSFWGHAVRKGGCRAWGTLFIARS